MTKTDGVHVNHCCSKHGCKYGDEDCPVYLGRLSQKYPCEGCSWDLESVLEALQTIAHTDESIVDEALAGLEGDSPEDYERLSKKMLNQFYWEA